MNLRKLAAEHAGHLEATIARLRETADAHRQEAAKHDQQAATFQADLDQWKAALAPKQKT